MNSPKTPESLGRGSSRHQRLSPTGARTETHWYEVTMLKTRLIAAATVLLVLAGCANDAVTSDRPVELGSASAAAGRSASGFNDTDVMFVQMMLPHSDQAVSMSDLLLDKRGVNSEVAALARQIREAQQAEIRTMDSWFEVMGRPQMEEGPHHGGLEGMLDENEMQQLDLANARDGQRLFLEAMIKHHTGAIDLAKREIADGQHPGPVELANHILTTQQQEIDDMTGLLTKL
jgi:uncharacterized protein (DUF305 family)